MSKIQRIMSRREKSGAGKKGKIRSISSIQPVTKSHKYWESTLSLFYSPSLTEQRFSSSLSIVSMLPDEWEWEPWQQATGTMESQALTEMEVFAYCTFSSLSPSNPSYPFHNMQLCVQASSRMRAMGGRGTGLRWLFFQAPGPAWEAGSCWKSGPPLWTTHTFLPGHQTDPKASTWWCAGDHLGGKHI